MLYERLLREYKEKVRSRKWKDMERRDKIKLSSILALGILFFVFICLYYRYAGTVFLSLAIGSFLGLLIGLIICERDERQFNMVKLQNYNERLETVKEILNDAQYRYYAVNQIDYIIEWCERYSSEEDSWIKYLRPFATFLAVVFMPVMFILLDKQMDNLEITDMLLSAGIFLLIAFVVFFLWHSLYVVNIKPFLDTKRILARCLAEDLRNLKLKEPRMPENVV